MASLPVYFEQRLVGTIDIDKSGPGFTYDPGWIGLRGAFPISTTMPLKSERIASDTFLPWAANLLPESEQLRTLGQLLGMARSDVIGLLSAIGGDTAGALSISQPGRTSAVQWRPVGKPEELERIIEDLPNKPFLVGEEGVSMSLAGTQSKLAVAVDEDGCICIPMNGSPSTHVLKPDSPRLWGGVQNEAFCLTLARRMKIPTPSVTTGQAGKRTYLLVKRYDRTDIGGRWRRLHQEDYCQALGNGYRPFARHARGECPRLQHRRACQELLGHDPRRRRVTGADVRSYVRRGLGARHEESRTEDRRRKSGRLSQEEALAAVRPRVRPQFQAGY